MITTALPTTILIPAPKEQQQDDEEYIYHVGTSGLKSVVMCALATERGLDPACDVNNNSQSSSYSCLCELLYDKKWLNSRQCT